MSQDLTDLEARINALAKKPRPAKPSSPYDDVIEKHAKTHGVDPELVRSVVRQESNNNPRAKNRKSGARGLMQLIPSTARMLGVKDPYDPDQNIEAGTRYLKEQLDEFKDPDLALAAYNAGPGKVRRFGGVPPYRETQDYIKKIGYQGSGYQQKSDLEKRIDALSHPAASPSDKADAVPASVPAAPRQNEGRPRSARPARRRRIQPRQERPAPQSNWMRFVTGQTGRGSASIVPKDKPITSILRDPTFDVSATPATEIQQGMARQTEGRRAQMRARLRPYIDKPIEQVVGQKAQEFQRERDRLAIPIKEDIFRRREAAQKSVGVDTAWTNSEFYGMSDAEIEQYARNEANQDMLRQGGRIDAAQIEIDRQARVAKLPFFYRTKENAKHAIEPILNAPNDVLQFAGQVFTYPGRAIDATTEAVTGRRYLTEMANYVSENVFGNEAKNPDHPGYDTWNPENNPIYQLGQASREEWDKILQIDKDYAQETAPQLINGISQVASQLLVAKGAGAVGAGSRVLTSQTRAMEFATGAMRGARADAAPLAGMVLYTSQSAQQAYVQAREYGATVDEARLAGLISGLITGATERIPFEQFLGNLSKLKGASKGFKRYVRDVGKAVAQGALSEGGQEGSEQFLQGVANTLTYGAPPQSLEQIKQAAGIGALVGGFAGGGSHAIGQATNRKPLTQETPVSPFIEPSKPETPTAPVEQATAPVPQSRVPTIAPSVPQTKATRTEEMRAFRDGDKPFVILDEGEQVPPLMRGEAATKIRGDRYVVHSTKYQPAKIRKMERSGELVKAAGYVDPEALGKTGVAVVAETKDNTEAFAAEVDPNKPELVKKQIEVAQEQFPEADIAVKPVDEVIEKRAESIEELKAQPTADLESRINELAGKAPSEGVEPSSRYQENMTIVQRNVTKHNRTALQGDAFRDVLMNESFGGNAGRSSDGQPRAGVNVAVNELGKIIEIGNYQSLKPDVREKLDSGKYHHATFLVRADGTIEQVIARGVPEPIVKILENSIMPAESVRPVATKTPVAEPPKEKASVAFMITRKMEADLKERGYSQADIDKMKPQDAQDILAAPVAGEAAIPKPVSKVAKGRAQLGDRTDYDRLVPEGPEREAYEAKTKAAAEKRIAEAAPTVEAKESEKKPQTADEAKAAWQETVKREYEPTWGTTAEGSTALSERQAAEKPTRVAERRAKVAAAASPTAAELKAKRKARVEAKAAKVNAAKSRAESESPRPALVKGELPVGKKQKIEVGAKGRRTTVDATVYGDWAIRKSGDRRSPYTVTHAPSGLTAGGAATIGEAKQLIKAFIQSGLDTSSPDLNTDTATLKRLAQIVQSTKQQSGATEPSESGQQTATSEALDLSKAKVVRRATGETMATFDNMRDSAVFRSELERRDIAYKDTLVKDGKAIRYTFREPPSESGDVLNMARAEKQTETPEFKRWFLTSKVVDDSGNPLVVYSGHSNLEMYGEGFDPKKATAGAFYASEDPAIASNYSVGKMGNKEYYENGDQYRFKLKNGKWGKKIWQMELTPEQQAKVREFMADENLGGGSYDIEQYWKENAPYDAVNRRALARGGLRDLQSIWQFLEYMGENIAYAKEGDAPYFQRQQKGKFEEILDYLDIPWQSREWSQPGVMPVYLRIRNPIDADNPFPSDLLTALKNVAKRERIRSDEGTQWTSEYPLRNWVADIEGGNEYWTTHVPAKAIPIIKSFGYDGFKERGMKGETDRSKRQINWVAFDKEQIKSVNNRGTFDESGNILKIAQKDASRLRATDMSDLLTNVRSTRKGATVTVSQEVAEIIRRTKGKDAAYPDAQFLTPPQARMLVKDLRERAALMRIRGYTLAEAKAVDGLADNLTRARMEAGTKRTVVIKAESAPVGAEEHEEQHRGAYLGASEKDLASWHKPERITERAKGVVHKAWREFYKDTPEYASASDALVDAEAIATLSEPDGYKKLGVTLEQAKEFMEDWYTSFAEKNGIQSLANFRRITDETRKAIGRVSTAQTRARDGGGVQSVSESPPPTKESASPGNDEVRNAEVGSAEDVAVQAAASNMSETDARMKNRQFGETLRRWQRQNVEDLGYITQTDAGWLEGADAILAKGSNAAIKEFNRMSSHEALKAPLGVLLGDQLGREGRIAEQQAMYRATMEVVGSHGAGLRATQAVSLDDPAYAEAAAGMLKAKSAKLRGKVGEPLTESERRMAYNVAVEGQNARDNQAEVDARLADALARQQELEERLKEYDAKPEKAGTLKAENEKLKAQIAKLKEGRPKTTLRHSSQRELLKALEADEEAILAEIRAKYQPALMMAKQGSGKGQSESDALTRYAEMQILRNLNKGVYGPTELRAEMEKVAGKLSDAEFTRVAVTAYSQILSTPKPLSPEAKQSSRNRREFAKLIRGEKAGPGKPDALARIAAGLDAPPEVLHGALLSRTITSPHDWRIAMKEAYPNADPNKTFRASQELLTKAKQELNRERLEVKAEKKLTDEEYIQTREEQKEARVRSVQARQNMNRYYVSLTRSRSQKVLEHVQDVLGAPRAILASNDASFALRQGLISLVTETKATSKALAKALPSYLSEKNYADLVEEARLHPNFAIAQRYGAKFSAIGDNPFEAGSEFFASRLAEHYPGVKRSEHLFTLQGDMVILNNFTMFREIIDARTDLDAEQKHEAYKKVIDFLNISVGKGNFAHLFGHGGVMEKVLNIAGFAPRFRMSRFQALNYMMNPVKLYNLPHGARKIIVKKAARFNLTVLAAMAPLAMLGLVGLDPEDKEHFLVLRFKDQKYDILGGLKEPFRLIAGLGLKMTAYSLMAAYGGITKDNDLTEKGTLGMSRIASEYDLTNNASSVRGFLRSGASPVVLSALNLKQGTDFAGKPTTLWSEATRNAFPIIAQQAWDSFTYDRKEQMMHEPDTYEKFKEKMQKALAGEFNKNIPGMVPQILSEAIGVGTSAYPERKYSLALKEAQYLSGSIGKKPKNPEASRIKRGLQNRYFDGEDMDVLVKEAKEYVKQGKLEQDDVKDIMDVKGRTPLTQKVQKMALEDVKKVDRFTTPDEKTALAPIIQEKEVREQKRSAQQAERNRNVFELEPKTAAKRVAITDDAEEAIELYKDMNPDAQKSLPVRAAFARKILSLQKRNKLTAEDIAKVKEIFPKLTMLPVKPTKARKQRPLSLPKGIEGI